MTPIETAEWILTGGVVVLASVRTVRLLRRTNTDRQWYDTAMLGLYAFLTMLSVRQGELLEAGFWGGFTVFFALMLPRNRPPGEQFSLRNVLPGWAR